MKIVIELDRTRLAVSEYVSETQNMYKVNRIDEICWDNRNYKRQVNKKDCLYSGELTPEIGLVVDQWNEALKNEMTEINIARAKREQLTDMLKKELDQKWERVK